MRELCPECARQRLETELKRRIIEVDGTENRQYWCPKCDYSYTEILIGFQEWKGNTTAMTLNFTLTNRK